MTDIRGYFKHISRGKNVSNSQILRRPQDDKDGVVDMALAFVAARQNSHPLQLLNNSLPSRTVILGLLLYIPRPTPNGGHPTFENDPKI